MTQAPAVVERDLATLTSPPSGLAVTSVGGTMHIALDGSVYGGDQLYGRRLMGEGELLVAVADAVQTLVSNNAGDEVWPVCPAHGYGLHPDLAGSAVWFCRAHEHVVGPIGALAPDRRADDCEDRNAGSCGSAGLVLVAAGVTLLMTDSRAGCLANDLSARCCRHRPGCRGLA